MSQSLITDFNLMQSADTAKSCRVFIAVYLLN